MSLLETLYPTIKVKPENARVITFEPTEQEIKAQKEELRRLYWEQYHNKKRSDPAYLERRRAAARAAKLKVQTEPVI